jgi:hypothetical protein
MNQAGKVEGKGNSRLGSYKLKKAASTFPARNILLLTAYLQN